MKYKYKRRFMVLFIIFLISPFVLFGLWQIKIWNCAEAEFTGFEDYALQEARIPGDTLFETLDDMAVKTYSLDHIARQLIVDIDPALVAEWVCYNAAFFEEFDAFYWQDRQPFHLKNYVEANFHSLVPLRRPKDFIQGNIAAQLHTIRWIGQLFVGKAMLTAQQGAFDEANFYLEYAFAVAAYMMDTRWVGARFGRYIYQDALALLVEYWPKDQLHESMRAWFPRKNSVGLKVMRLEWDFAKGAGDLVRRPDKVPGEKLRGLFASKIVGLNKEGTVRLVFEDYLDFIDQLDGPWMNWQAKPSSHLPEQDLLFDCYFGTKQFTGLRPMSLALLESLGVILIKSARAEVILSHALSGEGISRNSVEQVLAENRLMNPFTDEPYALDDKGNFLMEKARNIPLRAFHGLETSPMKGIVLKDSEGVIPFDKEKRRRWRLLLSVL